MGTLKFSEFAMVFGIVMGAIPDVDIISYPIGKKYPIWRHRGGSHSIFFIVVASIILAIIFAPIIKVDLLILIMIGIISGLGHICLDTVTTIGIPLFWPFSKKEVHLDLERAINPYFMGISLFLIFFLFQLRAINFNYQIYLTLINIIFISILIYYFSKLLLKLTIQYKFSTPTFKIIAIPTAGIFKWYLVGKKIDKGTIRLKYCRYNILKRLLPKFRYFSCNCSKNISPPLDNDEKAKTYTYNLKEVRSFIRRFKYPLAEVVENNTGHHWTVFWFPLELMGLNRAMAIRVDIDQNGDYKTKHSFFRKYSNI
jgi:inner membrane protein